MATKKIAPPPAPAAALEKVKKVVSKKPNKAKKPEEKPIKAIPVKKPPKRLSTREMMNEMDKHVSDKFH